MYHTYKGEMMKKNFNELTPSEMVNENEKAIKDLRYGIIGLLFIMFVSTALIASLFM